MDASERQEYLDKNTNPLALARATMNYASSAGLAGDIMDIGAGFASHWGGDFGERLGAATGARGKSSQLIGGVVAPSAGLAQDVYSGALDFDADKIVRSLPGSNLPYVSPWIKALLQD